MKLSIDRKLISYYIFIIMITICKGIGLNSSNIVYRSLFFLSLIFLIFKITSDRWSKLEIEKIVAILLLFFVNYFITGDESLLFTFFVCVGLKTVSLKSLLKIIFFTRMPLFVGTLLFAYMGVIPNKQVVFWRSGEFIMRYGYGFDHPNLLHSSFAILVLLYFYIYYSKSNLFSILVVNLINFEIYQLSYSRTGFFIVILNSVLVYLSKKSHLATKILEKITPYLQYILLVVTVLLVTVFSSSALFSELDNLLTGRLSYAREQLQSGITFLGKSFSTTDILFDNSYSMMLSLYGGVITFILLFCYYKTSKKITVYHRVPELIVFFIISVQLSTESYIGNALINITLLFIAKDFYGELEHELEIRGEL